MKSRFLRSLAFFAAGTLFSARLLAGDPPISPSDPASVQRGIDEAIAAGAAKVTIPPGVYRLPGLANKSCHLHFEGTHDFEIDATGVTLIGTNCDKPFLRFVNCHNVTLRGATILRDPIPFSQGRIEAVDENGAWVAVRIDKGYPMEIDNPELFPKIWLNVFDPQTRRWKRDFFSGKSPNVERLGPDLFRYDTGNKKPANVAVGDLVSWRGKILSDIRLEGCAKMKIVGVTIRNGGGFCMLEDGGDGDNYYNYTVTYGPKPEGAEANPLMSANADAFHSNRTRKGPTLEGCLFEGMDDDGVPIHGTYAMVMESQGNQVVIDSRGGPFCRPGDPLRLLNEAGAIVSDAKVVDSNPAPSYKPSQPYPKGFRTYQDPKDAHYLTLTLDHEVSLPFGTLVANENANGNGFVVRNCTVKNNRARGMLIKAGNGLIENCTIEGSTMGGIVISPEMGYWNESDYAHRLVIRNNTIRSVNAWKTQPGSAQCGAITVAAFEHGRFVPLPGGHRDITIENNRFEANDGPNLLISSAIGVQIRGNRFIRPMSQPSDHGENIGINPSALVWITESDKISLKDNTVEHPGAAFGKPLEATPSATGDGFEDGIKVMP